MADLISLTLLAEKAAVAARNARPNPVWPAAMLSAAMLRLSTVAAEETASGAKFHRDESLMFFLLRKATHIIFCKTKKPPRFPNGRSSGSDILEMHCKLKNKAMASSIAATTFYFLDPLDFLGL
jgi:hypothetical protein